MEGKSDSRLEARKPQPISHKTMITDQGVVTDEILENPCKGSGTTDDPYIVAWMDDDPRNPMIFPMWKKWVITFVVAVATLAVSFVSSAYTGGVDQVILTFGISEEVATLGVSLFVVGFAVGPLLWAPMSELYGRQLLFLGTYVALTAFNAGAAGSQNPWTLLILRFFAGAFGASPLTNAGGVIADMFEAKDRGIALSIFAAAPFMGPVLGPIVGGFVGESIGWRWLQGIMAIFTGVLTVIGACVVPETYPPVLLRRRAQRLTKVTGKVYKSKADAEQGEITAAHAFKTAISRPWVLLLKEPIVLLLTIYMAIIYGTLYMFFTAYPIVYQQVRGWSQGIGGLAFLGVAVGMMSGVVYSIFDNKRYVKCEENDPSGFAPPEARLPPCQIGSIAIPIGLFWFAWTNYPSIQWIVSVMAGAPFGFGIVLVFLSVMNYLIDAYTIFAASVLAANSVLRSLFGAIFPLFTTYMYDSLGIHWATSIPAFLALACLPFPFLFYTYGPRIRRSCKFAAEADDFLRKMRGQEALSPETEEEERESSSEAEEKEQRLAHQHEAIEEQNALDYSYEGERYRRESVHSGDFQQIRIGADPSRGQLHRTTSASGRSVGTEKSGVYSENPYDIDRVNTRESFGPRGRGNSRVHSTRESAASSRTRGTN